MFSYLPPLWFLAGALILGLGAVGFAFIFPQDLDLNLKIEVFRTLAQVGGVLLGLIGGIGVFALQSVKSAALEIRRLQSDADLSPPVRIRGMSNALGRLAAAAVPMSTFLISLGCLLLQIMTAILGLASVATGNFNVLLALNFALLFLGVISLAYTAILAPAT